MQGVLDDVGLPCGGNDHCLLIFTQTAEQVVPFELYLPQIVQVFQVLHGGTEVIGESEPGVLHERLIP